MREFNPTNTDLIILVSIILAIQYSAWLTMLLTGRFKSYTQMIVYGIPFVMWIKMFTQ